MNASEGPRALPLTRAYEYASNHGLEREIGEIRTMEIEWDLSYTSSLRRGYVIELFEAHGLMEEFIQEEWPIGSTSKGESRRKRYLRILDRYRDYLSGNENEEEQDEDLSEQAFAAESDLRDFLAKNLECIEPGLRIYQENELAGIEYAIEGGRIDILAVDKDDKFVVIELKLSRGRNKTLGQILFYMGWVDSNLGNGPCRGIVIAREISDDLKLAAQRATGVSLFRYHLKVSVEKVM